MGSIERVRRNPHEVGQRSAAHIHRELRERNDVRSLCRRVAHIAEIRKRIVPLVVKPAIASQVSGARDAFFIRLPGQALGYDFLNQVVVGDSSAECIIDRLRIPRRQHEVIWNRGMRVRVVTRQRRILRRQAIQVWHRRIADHIGIAGILQNHDGDMSELRHRRYLHRAVWSVGGTATASGEG